MGRDTMNDQRLEIIVGGILRFGVMVAAAVVFVGAIIYLAHHGSSIPHYQVFRSKPSDLRTFAGIAGDLAHLRGRGIIQFGILLLIATPILRVAFSLVAFALERDKLYVVVTALVLAALLFGLLGRV